jgi:hypothetical protein
MFERYTERARRAIFFARYEASQYGSTTIETDHLLLGFLREDRHLIQRFLQNTSPEGIRDEIIGGITAREKVSTSIDMPLSLECKRILAYAAEESERLKHPHIGTEHLLLGFLREENCVAARILNRRGLKIDAVREELVRAPVAHLDASQDLRPIQVDLSSHPALPESGVVPDGNTAMRIAEAVWTPLYGADTIKSQTPLEAELRHNVWIVTGSAATLQPEAALFAFILQTDGRILSVGRGRL